MMRSINWDELLKSGVCDEFSRFAVLPEDYASRDFCQIRIVAKHASEETYYSKFGCFDSVHGTVLLDGPVQRVYPETRQVTVFEEMK